MNIPSGENVIVDERDQDNSDNEVHQEDDGDIDEKVRDIEEDHMCAFVDPLRHLILVVPFDF